MIECVAFDCFGTVFDMSGVSREEIAAYVRHVKADDFSPFKFPESWWSLKAWPGVGETIDAIRDSEFVECVTLSNGSRELLKHLSDANGIKWDLIVDLAAHRVYKPHRGAYLTIHAEIGVKPEATLMVTANPTFGDVEGSASVGMPSFVIRDPAKFWGNGEFLEFWKLVRQ